MLIQQTNTAINSYRDFIASGGKSKQADKVFKAIQLLGIASDGEVSDLTCIPVSRVSARRNELEKAGKIEKAKVDEDKISKKIVIKWKVNEAGMNLFTQSRISTQKKFAMIKELCERQNSDLGHDILKILNS